MGKIDELEGINIKIIKIKSGFEKLITLSWVNGLGWRRLGSRFFVIICLFHVTLSNVKTIAVTTTVNMIS